MVGPCVHGHYEGVLLDPTGGGGSSSWLSIEMAALSVGTHMNLKAKCEGGSSYFSFKRCHILASSAETKRSQLSQPAVKLVRLGLTRGRPGVNLIDMEYPYGRSDIDEISI
jgi:hypothetical protein